MLIILNADATYKIAIFGESNVGKTTLTQKYLTGIFKMDTQLTMGAEIFIKYLEINNKKIVLQIWDFGGEKLFRSPKANAYIIKGAAGFIFMYDITRNSSLNNFKEWINLLKIELTKKIPIVLVGNKKDLENDRVIGKELAEEYLKDFEKLDLVECSSKTGENVNEIFQKITLEMIDNVIE